MSGPPRSCRTARVLAVTPSTTDAGGQPGRPRCTTRPRSRLTARLEPAASPAIYPIVRSRRGFATVIVSISASRHAGGPEARQERVGQVRVAVAAEGRELRVVADVLAQEQAVGMAAAKELADQLDGARLAEALALPGHPDEVELEVRAALDDREVVVEDRVRIGVADDHAGRDRRLPPRRSGAARARRRTGRRGS